MAVWEDDERGTYIIRLLDFNEFVLGTLISIRIRVIFTCKLSKINALSKREYFVERTAKYIFFISAGVASVFTPRTSYGLFEEAKRAEVACNGR